MNNDFKMHFGQIFNLKIANLPQNINLQVKHKHAYQYSNFTLYSAHTHSALMVFYMNVCVGVLVGCRCLKRQAYHAPSWLKSSSQYQDPQW